MRVKNFAGFMKSRSLNESAADYGMPDEMSEPGMNPEGDSYEAGNNWGANPEEEPVDTENEENKENEENEEEVTLEDLKAMIEDLTSRIEKLEGGEEGEEEENKDETPEGEETPEEEPASTEEEPAK